MGLLAAIKKRLTNQFIGVIVLEDACFVKMKRIKNGALLTEEEKRFDLSAKDRLSNEIIGYLQKLQEEVEQTYIALFLNSYGQGVVPSCLQSAYEKFHIDYTHVKDICIDNRYSIYASDIDIKWAQKLFAKTGLDFLFSPFILLENMISRDVAREGVVLYMLAGVNSIAVMIFDKKELLYGTFINIAREEDLLATDFEEEAEGDEKLDENLFDDIDLELELEESEEISDILEDAEQGIMKKVEKDTETVTIKNRLFGQDLRLVKYFDASLREFYESDLYRSDFITYVKIFDGVRLNPDVVEYLREQLLIQVDLESVDLLDEIVELAIKEVVEDA